MTTDERTILLVEDEDDIREVARASLELTRGWTVEDVDSGARGVERARELRPDAVVLDVMMPGLDGPATLERLRADEETREIPVIFMTAKVQAGERERLESLGVEGLIAKPFDPMTLGDRIAALLGWG